MQFSLDFFPGFEYQHAWPLMQGATLAFCMNEALWFWEISDLQTLSPDDMQTKTGSRSANKLQQFTSLDQAEILPLESFLAALLT